jgi:hypothetical protein
MLKKFRLILLLLCLLSVSATLMQAQPKPSEQPVAVEYYYQTKWGYAEEFMRLFRKNHLPILKEQMKSGRIVSLKIEKPRYHSTEDSRWDFRVTIVFKNIVAANDNTGEDELIKRLYPDQKTFKEEEQRRFEILIAHWDVPIFSVPLDN